MIRGHSKGRTDQEVADRIGKARETVWRWKNNVPFFMATLEARRQEVFGVAVNRLRGLLSKAIDNIAKDIEDGDVKSSFELVKATGLHGFQPPHGETNVRILTEQLCLEVLAREHIPEKDDFLLNIGKNPRFEQRKREILEELGRGEAIS
jgi:hypothetical protein